ncbi:MAG: RNA polymerase sigma-70 factor [Chitinophagaceae bacterium]
MSTQNGHSILSDDLIPRLHQGDESALEVIFQHYYPPLCFYARKIIRDAEESRDIVTNVFTVFWQKSFNFPDHQKIKSFLYISVRNACYDFLDKLKTKDKAQKEIRHYTEVTEEINPAELEEIRSKVWESVYSEIQALPNQMKTVFKMLYFDGLKTKEISEKMNLSEQTVRNYKINAIALLKKKIFTEDFLLTTTLVVAGLQLAGLAICLLVYFLG